MTLNVAVDFDGVLNTYDGWKGEYELFEPRRGVGFFLSKLDEKYNIIIFTNRKPQSVWRWLEDYNLACFVKEVTNTKPRAFVYVDDRGLKFEGDFDKTLKIIDSFTTHWEPDSSEFIDGGWING